MIPGKAAPLSHRLNARLVLVVLLVLAAVVLRLSADWRIEPVSGQTIPWPTRTPTYTPLGMVTSTPTWTPRPTWTRVQTAVAPTTGATSSLSTPTATSTALRPSPTLAALTQTSPTPSIAPETPTLAATTALTPLVTSLPARPLAFEVVQMPQVAGPGDRVSFVVQVANVGYDLLEGIRVVGRVPAVLAIESSDCGPCTVEKSSDQASYLLGIFKPGEQVVFTVTGRVVDDAWPGQQVSTEWTLWCPSQPAQTLVVELTLPWAPLPATGSIY